MCSRFFRKSVSPIAVVRGFVKKSNDDLERSLGFNSLYWYGRTGTVPHLFYFIYEISYFYDLNDYFQVRMQKVVQLI